MISRRAARGPPEEVGVLGPRATGDGPRPKGSAVEGLAACGLPSSRGSRGTVSPGSPLYFAGH